MCKRVLYNCICRAMGKHLLLTRLELNSTSAHITHQYSVAYAETANRACTHRPWLNKIEVNLYVIWKEPICTADNWLLLAFFCDAIEINVYVWCVCVCVCCHNDCACECVNLCAKICVLASSLARWLLNVLCTIEMNSLAHADTHTHKTHQYTQNHQP